MARSAIREQDREFLLDYLLATLGKRQSPKGDIQVPDTPAAYGDVAMETLLEVLQPQVEQLSGLELYPTYSYVRLYKHGDALKRHTDRPSCEISATLCLGCVPEAPWPIWIDRGEGPIAIALGAGDMLVYRGREVAHWREEYGGERVAQVFLHYVDCHGPFREWMFDKRKALRTPAIAGHNQT